MSNYGIVLIAVGHELYGRLAFNCALSIKANDKNARIALLYNEQGIMSLNERHTKFFDVMIELPPDTYTHKGNKEYQKAKTEVYDYSPFDTTLYLDADTIWIPGRKVSWLFGELGYWDFTIQNNAYYDIVKKKSSKPNYLYWGDPVKIMKYYSLKSGFMPQTSTTFMFFKKNIEIRKYFDMVKAIYYDDDTPVKRWNNGKPDEYCFNVASAILNVQPHKYHYYPVYYNLVSGLMLREKIYANYWAITNGGNKLHKNIIKLYNDMVNEYCIKNKIPDRFYHQDKKDIIDTRKLM